MTQTIVIICLIIVCMALVYIAVHQTDVLDEKDDEIKKLKGFVLDLQEMIIDLEGDVYRENIYQNRANRLQQ